MNALELLDIISLGETSKVEFKETLTHQESFVAEMIAMSNSKGGLILLGVEDKTGKIKGLSYEEVQEFSNKTADIANNLIKPQIYITTDIVSVEDNRVLIISIEEGIAKPYKDNKGTIWVKQGPDKRRLTDNNEQIRLFQQSGMIYIDEMIVPNTSISDIDKDKVKNYLNIIDESLSVKRDETLYKNLNILRDGSLTLVGLLFFSKNPQQYRPAFCIKAVAYYGNDISGIDYRGSKDITGTMPEIYDEAMGFFKTYLKLIQENQDFNSIGKLEISQIAIEELLQNAITHRDYSKNAPIKIFIFDNRVEIISPGALPNSLSIENIIMGNSVVRNNLIVSFAARLMKYRGIGSGIRRVLKEEPNIELINDTEGEEFKVIIPRVVED